MNPTPEINLLDQLRFDPEQGLIHLKDYRMVMWSACALGALRRELIKTLGWDRTRGLLKRFGYAAGLADGLALAELFPEATRDRHTMLGPALHALEGITKVVVIPEETEVDLEQGIFHYEAYWENSFEAAQHLEMLGPSEHPVCWTLVGYASAHSSSAAGRPTVVIETECQAMGHERCRFSVRLADDAPEAAREEEADYAQQYLPKILEDLRRTIRKSERRIRALNSQVRRIGPKGNFLGESAALHAALDTARSVAPYDTTVLTLGESGTGKELMARFIHDESPYSEGPFVAVNCSALPENLQEAELFGHVKGAFTGAVGDGIGVFEAAHGGTLFLDEIGDLALTAQTKILRALQEGEIKRIGENKTRKVDVRVIAATHRDLVAMTAEQSFREDLYYRLSVISIVLPPLRDRGNDVLLLAEHFRKVYNERFGKNLKGFDQEASRTLIEHPWPGNVRELENAIQRAVILADGEIIQAADLLQRRPPMVETPSDLGAVIQRPLAVHGSESSPVVSLGFQDEAERIRQALESAGGSRRRAAEILGIGRTTLWRRMKELGL